MIEVGSLPTQVVYVGFYTSPATTFHVSASTNKLYEVGVFYRTLTEHYCTVAAPGVSPTVLSDNAGSKLQL